MKGLWEWSLAIIKIALGNALVQDSSVCCTAPFWSERSPVTVLSLLFSAGNEAACTFPLLGRGQNKYTSICVIKQLCAVTNPTKKRLTEKCFLAGAGLLDPASHFWVSQRRDHSPFSHARVFWNPTIACPTGSQGPSVQAWGADRGKSTQNTPPVYQEEDYCGRRLQDLLVYSYLAIFQRDDWIC